MAVAKSIYGYELTTQRTTSDSHYCNAKEVSRCLDRMSAL